MFVRFFKCSFVLRVGAVIFELDEVSMSRNTLSEPKPDSASYTIVCIASPIYWFVAIKGVRLAKCCIFLKLFLCKNIERLSTDFT